MRFGAEPIGIPLPEQPVPPILDAEGNVDACAQPCASTLEQLVTAAPMARVSREGLTLEAMSRFISFVLRGHHALHAEVRKAIEQLGERGSNILHVEHLDQVLRGVSGDVATPGSTPTSKEPSSKGLPGAPDSIPPQAQPTEPSPLGCKPRANTLTAPAL